MFRRLSDFFSTARDVGRVKRLVKELSTFPRTPDEAHSALMAELSGNRRSTDTALQEFATLMASRAAIAAVLAQHGYTGPTAQAKLVDVYKMLSRRAPINVGRNFVPTAALYDPGLLAVMLTAEAASPDSIGTLAMNYLEKAGAATPGTQSIWRVPWPFILDLLLALIPATDAGSLQGKLFIFPAYWIALAVLRASDNWAVRRKWGLWRRVPLKVVMVIALEFLVSISAL